MDRRTSVEKGDSCPVSSYSAPIITTTTLLLQLLLLLFLSPLYYLLNLGDRHETGNIGCYFKTSSIRASCLAGGGCGEREINLDLPGIVFEL